jgi:hypothetical protein
METQRYVRKPMFVEAIQVTKDNFREIAKWCNGTAYESSDGHITIRVLRTRSTTIPRTKAFLGDWVLSSENGFRVYTNNAFLKAFDQMPEVSGEWPLTHEEAIQLTFNFEKEV